MDIEGSEMRALHGAVNIIKKYKPKCTVSTYHHISDLWNIPLFLVNLHSNYNFSIVHHTENMWDTVYYIW